MVLKYCRPIFSKSLRKLEHWPRFLWTSGCHQNECSDVRSCDVSGVGQPKDVLDPSITQPRVIIVGAGIAGLSAADHLIKHGINNLVILEASKRVGGRIQTCTVDGAVMDFGARWLFDASILNSIFTLAAQEQLLSYPLPLANRFKGTIVLSDGTPISDDIREKSLSLLKTLTYGVREIKNNPRLSDFNINDSLFDFVMKNTDLEITLYNKQEGELVKRVMLALTNCMKAELGANTCDVPVGQIPSYKHCFGNSTYIEKGFASVLDPLVKTIGKENIKFGEEVCLINWSDTTDDCRVMVRTSEKGVYHGDFVIVTVSLGVMKRNESLFSPKLPADKLEVIQTLGFGDITKVFFMYDKPFWVHGEGSLRICCSLEDTKSNSSWMNSLGLIQEIPGSRKGLGIAIGGAAAQELEQLPTEEVLEDFTGLIRKVMGNPTLPYPSKIFRTNWRSNKLFSGAVTYSNKHTLTGHTRTLAEAVPYFNLAPSPTLLFAGEATAQGMTGTAHGARNSGIREAKRILGITHRFRGPPPLK